MAHKAMPRFFSGSAQQNLPGSLSGLTQSAKPDRLPVLQHFDKTITNRFSLLRPVSHIIETAVGKGLERSVFGEWYRMCFEMA